MRKLKERLALKSRHEVEGIFAHEPVETDLSTTAFNTLVDRERVAKELKKQLQSREWTEGVDEDEVERLQAMHQELLTMLRL